MDERMERKDLGDCVIKKKETTPSHERTVGERERENLGFVFDVDF